MDYTIRPYEGVGPIRFGLTPDAVRTTAGETPRSFFKTKESAFPTDKFQSLAFYVYYKKPGVAEAIELFSPATPELLGRTLIDKPFNTTRDWLATLDEALEMTDTGLTSPRFGISLYAPYALKKPRERIESVLAFEKGYWD